MAEAPEMLEKLLDAFLDQSWRWPAKTWLWFEHLFRVASYPIFIFRLGEDLYRCEPVPVLVVRKRWWYPSLSQLYEKLVDGSGNVVAYRMTTKVGVNGSGTAVVGMLPLRPIECIERESGEKVVLEPEEEALRELAAFLRRALEQA